MHPSDDSRHARGPGSALYSRGRSPSPCLPPRPLPPRCRCGRRRHFPRRTPRPHAGPGATGGSPKACAARPLGQGNAPPPPEPVAPPPPSGGPAAGTSGIGARSGADAAQAPRQTARGSPGSPGTGTAGCNARPTRVAPSALRCPLWSLLAGPWRAGWPSVRRC